MATPSPAAPLHSSRVHLDRWSDLSASMSSDGSKTWDIDATAIECALDQPHRPELPTIPGLTFINEVGRGGMGVVYQAQQESLKRLVAVKLLHGGSLAAAEERYRFRLESEVAAHLKHPNVVQVHEAGSYQGRDFLILEWVESGSLQRWQSGKPIAPRQSAAIVAALADGIQAAHSMGVLHRDLKPANVLLAESTEPGELPFVPKVTDFGMAKRLHDPGVTRAGYAVGTPHYMAPEQARGETNSTAVDVYALGAILYELLTGQTPFQGNAHLVLHQLIHEEPTSLLKFRPELPRDLVSICQKAMQKEPANRYATAMELAADLRRYLDHQPVLARPISGLHRVVRWARRHPAVAALLCTLAFTILGSLAGMTWLYFQAEARREQAELSDQLRQRKEEASRELNRFFLRDFFKQATPSKTLGKSMSFAEALQAMAAGIDTDPALKRLREFPELVASTKRMLGNTLIYQGKPNDARILLEDAYAWYERNTPADDDERQMCRSDLLHLLLEQGQLQKVEPLLREKVAFTERKYGPVAHPTVAARSNLVGVCYELGKLDEAIALNAATLAALRELQVQDNEEVIHTFSNQVFLLQKAGRFVEAESASRECLRECEVKLPREHPKRIIILNNLSTILRSLRREQEALPVMQEALALCKKVNGPAHQETLLMQSNYAGLLRELKQLDEAQALLEDAWQTAKAKKLKHPVVYRILDALANLAAEREQLETARILAEELLQAVRSSLDPKHQLQAQARATLGAILLRDKQYAAAKFMLEEAIQLAKPHGTALADLHQKSVHHLAQCVEAIGKMGKAFPPW